MEFKFEEWLETLSQKEKDKAHPQSEILKKGGDPYRAIFHGYFIEKS